jgi:hypothetical protein
MISYSDMTCKVNEWLARAHTYAPTAGDIPPSDVLDHMDILTVAADLPLAHRAGTQVERFRELARTGHQFKTKPQPPLRPSQRIRVLINGQGVYCRVRDVRAVLDQINAERAAGRRTIGLLTQPRDGGPQVQIDVV